MLVKVAKKEKVNTWPDEALFILKLGKAKGTPTSQISIQLQKAGYSYTKNAVIGKIHRLGIAGPPPPVVKAPEAKQVQKVASPVKPKSVPAPVLEKPKEKKPPQVERKETVAKKTGGGVESPNPVTLEQFTSNTCKWPLGSFDDRPPYLFCGNPVMATETGQCDWTCEGHHRIAFQPVRERFRPGWRPR